MELKKLLSKPQQAAAAVASSLAAIFILPVDEIIGVVASDPGMIFSVVTVGVRYVVPNVQTVLAGEASLSTTILVGSAALYVVLLADKIIDKIRKRQNNG